MANTELGPVLVLYYSAEGHTEAMARQVVRGVERVDGMTARLRTVPPVRDGREPFEAADPDSGPPWVEREDLAECSGLVLGSPTRFGNMAASLKYFLDGTAGECAHSIGLELPIRWRRFR